MVTLYFEKQPRSVTKMDRYSQFGRIWVFWAVFSVMNTHIAQNSMQRTLPNLGDLWNKVFPDVF